VHALLPGHRLIVEGGETRLERYWSLGVDRVAGLRLRSYDDQVDAVANVLEESARLQLVSDVPLGAFLSGGVDSSILVAVMTKAVGTRVKTFSVGFADEGSAIDETADAERMARHLGTDHTTSIVTGDDVRNRITAIAAALDQPSVDGVNSYFVSSAARRSVTVAVSGTGADELFAGYPWFITMVRETDPWWPPPRDTPRSTVFSGDVAAVAFIGSAAAGSLGPMARPIRSSGLLEQRACSRPRLQLPAALVPHRIET
jgi:asparagine synthase (glutamine-hydrolysing)